MPMGEAPRRLLRQIKFGGGSLTRLEPQTKGLVKKRMTIEEYLEHQPEEETADSNRISSILDSEASIWSRVWWRLLEEEFWGGISG
ncbi:hypothetical protein COX00_03045 [Candidatus Uhrbacteria bacterium CG22_combo_CG10-13_8_21_14_all_47_17]|uniref:Uncharacterized protein n=1 Tax=Candidatus Uhrbacteria bacterium CG22_combo_CG10-13_8_21_14_all_47_17 TaxID=1975041 RepID=A0A2H0BS21_9BACT|nr:MAG: hypothetical protein COX00_03045 [Candidatus Uhrbacteria bacterium CG22_combo_CG10-13_8_21_14_all_47_17]